MLPAYSLDSIFYCADPFKETEAKNITEAIHSIIKWGESNGISFKASFSDPLIKKELENVVEKIVIDNKISTRIKRLFNGKKSESETYVERMIQLTENESVELAIFGTTIEFSEAAILALDCVSVSNFHAMGKTAKNTLVICFSPTIKSFSLWIHLYRFDDDVLVIRVTLTSTDAYKDKVLQSIGDEYMLNLRKYGDYR